MISAGAHRFVWDLHYAPQAALARMIRARRRAESGLRPVSTGSSSPPAASVIASP